MDKQRIIAFYNQDQRIESEWPGMRREVLPDVVRLIDTGGVREGAVTYSRLDETNADDVIRAQIAFFGGIGQDFEWKLYDYDRPADLKDRLASQGLEVGEAEAIMVLPLEDAGQLLVQPIAPAVRRITKLAGIADVVTVHQQVWEEPPSSLGPYLEQTLKQDPERMSIYVAYVDDQPASAAWVYFPPRGQFASLWGGSTLSAFRHRGLYTSLLAVRAQEARDRHAKFLTVDASPMSRPILEKFGFQMIAISYPCKWKVPSGTRASS
jgi:hypothetical protein